MTLLGINSSEVRWQTPDDEAALQSTVTVMMSDAEPDEKKQDSDVTDDEVPVDDDDVEGEMSELDKFNEADFDDDFDDDFEEEIEDEEFQDEDEFDLGIDIS
jgi:hypothetical protein